MRRACEIRRIQGRLDARVAWWMPMTTQANHLNAVVRASFVPGREAGYDRLGIRLRHCAASMTGGR